MNLDNFIPYHRFLSLLSYLILQDYKREFNDVKLAVHGNFSL